MDEYTKAISAAMRPLRSLGAQLLRDAALGHKEYPDEVEDK